jgi:hypothetical protein
VIFTLSFLGSKPRMEKENINLPNEKRGAAKQLVVERAEG